MVGVLRVVPGLHAAVVMVAALGLGGVCGMALSGRLGDGWFLKHGATLSLLSGDSGSGSL